MIATQASSPPSFASQFQSTSTTTNTTTSPPRTPRRPSMSNPMSWLSRSSSTHSHSNSAGSATMRISEPKLVNDMFTSTGGTTYTHTRYGTLGMGATVVRTPQDALTRAMAQQPYPAQDHPGAEEDVDDGSSYEEEPEPASPGSPPLPPLPLFSKSFPNLPALSELGELVDDVPAPSRSPPKRPPPAIPQARPVLKSSPTSPAVLPAVPTLPLNIAPTPPQPPFTPILLTPVPDTLDHSSLIITLETTNGSHRTTFATLTSRPSHLADYLNSLAHSAREREKRKFRDTLVEEEEEYAEEYDDEEDDGHKLSSPNTPFHSLFAAHLTSAGLLPQSAGMIHLFLDRPTAPYAHILAYLRSPVANAVLPRTVALGNRQSQSHERLEALLELRDEAKYLGLDELHKLCCDELRHRQGHVRVRTGSNASNASSGGSSQQVVPEPVRGREAGLVRLGAIVRREAKPTQGVQVERDSTGSFGHASATSEVAHIESVPTSPVAVAMASIRTMSPAARAARSRSHSRSNARSASDWI